MKPYSDCYNAEWRSLHYSVESMGLSSMGISSGKSSNRSSSVVVIRTGLGRFVTQAFCSFRLFQYTVPLMMHFNDDQFRGT